jgi:hypothetical protein
MILFQYLIESGSFERLPLVHRQDVTVHALARHW